MILTYGESKVGLVRKVNEDAISLSVPDVYLLADGMGGYDGGQLASRLAVSAAEDFFRRKCEEPVSEALMKEAVLAANDAILSEKMKTPALSSMGTTMVVCAFSERQVFWAHVGDSRLYVWQDGSLSQVTVDHSFVMQLVAEGKISKEEMRLHPRKNEITRAVGIERPLSVDTGCFPVSKGTLILLCSDGLSGMVEDDTLSRVIGESPRKEQTDIDALGHRLMELVYAAGARDNVSVILALFE